jgi:hypothetical protein
MNVQDDWIRNQFHRPDDDGQLFATVDDDGEEFEAPQSAIAWLRLILAMSCLGTVGWLSGHRFLDHVVHHVWDQSRNSPAALIVPVLAVEFLWIIVHLRTGGALARLKIGLGAAAICVALFAPIAPSAGNAPRWGMDLRQVCALSLAAWVFVDGWRDRRSNLQDDRSGDLAGHRT